MLAESSTRDICEERFKKVDPAGKEVIFIFTFFMTSYLNNIIGKTLNSSSISTSTVIPLNQNGKELLTIANSLMFEDFRLDINNPVTIEPNNKSFEDLIGEYVIAIKEDSKEIELKFSNNAKLKINMRDEVYYDPEAMVLYGPNDLCVVWN